MNLIKGSKMLDGSSVDIVDFILKMHWLLTSPFMCCWLTMYIKYMVIMNEDIYVIGFLLDVIAFGLNSEIIVHLDI